MLQVSLRYQEDPICVQDPPGVVCHWNQEPHPLLEHFKLNLPPKISPNTHQTLKRTVEKIIIKPRRY